MTYIQAIGSGFPTVQCHSSGNGSVYSDLIWDGGDSIPDQSTLDAWITAHPLAEATMTVSKYQFRKLFTLTERVGIDAAPLNTAIPAQYRAMLVTMNKDMELSGDVQLDNTDVEAGVMFLEQLGLIAVGRGAHILSNTPPA
jgi:hypothetical protein